MNDLRSILTFSNRRLGASIRLRRDNIFSVIGALAQAPITSVGSFGDLADMVVLPQYNIRTKQPIGDLVNIAGYSF